MERGGTQGPCMEIVSLWFHGSLTERPGVSDSAAILPGCDFSRVYYSVTKRRHVCFQLLRAPGSGEAGLQSWAQLSAATGDTSQCHICLSQGWGGDGGTPQRHPERPQILCLCDVNPHLRSPSLTSEKGLEFRDTTWGHECGFFCFPAVCSCGSCSASLCYKGEAVVRIQC